MGQGRGIWGYVEVLAYITRGDRAADRGGRWWHKQGVTASSLGFGRPSSDCTEEGAPVVLFHGAHLICAWGLAAVRVQKDIKLDRLALLPPGGGCGRSVTELFLWPPKGLGRA